jgi:hypothetical protein
MAVLGVKVWNYKKHKNLELKLNGRNTFFVGDIAAGKSCILDLIQSANMQKEFPTDPLTTGEEAGGVEIQEELDGKEYTIKRTFTGKDNGRWVVTAKNGDKPPSLTALLDRILSKTLKNGFFDYTTYFFELKSPQARADYIIKSCGGEEVADNLKTITEKVKQRRIVGSDRTQQKAVYEQLGEINKEQLIEKAKIYAKEKTQDDATEIYNKILLEKKPTDNLELRIESYKKEVDRKTKLVSAINENNETIKELEAKILALKNQNKVSQSEVDKSFATEKLFKELLAEQTKLLSFNKEVEERADKKFTEEVSNVIKFNAEYKDFHTSLRALKEFNRLDKEWNIIDTEITDLENKNKELFISKLPIPELGLTTKETEKETISVVTYKGREFSFENLSKGESIIIAAQIQNALNPGGNNFIVIPEANLLGSKLDDILEECKKFKIQALVEVTQRKQEFKIIFEEEFMKS